jgi:hypothetical protein
VIPAVVYRVLPHRVDVCFLHVIQRISIDLSRMRLYRHNVIIPTGGP